jgi:hypothetical protein
VKVLVLPHKRLLTLGIADPKPFREFPADSKIRIRLVENKIVEVVDFGTLAAQRPAVELKNSSFSAPSCQLRIASTDVNKPGLLLGSTDTWTLQTDRDSENGRSTRGILNFQPKNTAPRTWKLDIRDNDYPVVYVDERIPDPRGWARSDPLFVSTSLSSILSDIFDEILDQDSPADVDWMADWIRWADSLMTGKSPPPKETSRREKKDWIEDLVDTFCQRHRVADNLLAKLISDGAGQ